MGRPWFTRAVIYEVDVRQFLDGNGDGVGDFQGLTERLDYIAGLGVNTIWLNPFFASPGRDGGYDIADFYAVDPALGSLGDFTVFLEEAKALGLRVIIELVVNHTSDQHPWFQEALTSRHAPTRDYYVWVDEPPDDSPERIVFTPEEEDDPSVWTFHEPTGQYYLHRFYSHEPDLDHANPKVRDEVFKIMSTWLALGVDGFRVDAAPYVAAKAAGGEDIDDAHTYLRALRSHISDRQTDAILMAEADVEASVLGDYFGDGDEMNLLLSFLASQTIFLALAEGSAEPLQRMCEVLPASPTRGAYANFLRNHDELDLERLSPEDREIVLDTFAPRAEMRIFGRGIRRRPAPMLGGDPDRLRLAHSLTFTLPGVPIVRYGDEIGMGDDLDLPDRASVRTPMQWRREPNAGFSSTDGRLRHPAIDRGPYSYEEVNVADQESEPDSQLNWTRRLIHARRTARPMRSGVWDLIAVETPAVLGLRFEDGDDVVLTFHNLADEPAAVGRDALGGLEYLHPVFADGKSSYRPATAGDPIELAPSGYLWLAGRR